MEAAYNDDSMTGSAAMQWKNDVSRKFQYLLDKSTPHPVSRWVATLFMAVLYCLRVYYVKGYYIVAYGLGICLLNLLIGFLSPQERAFNFGDNQILQIYGFTHKSLSSRGLKRTRNDTDKPLEVKDDLGLLRP